MSDKLDQFTLLNSAEIGATITPTPWYKHRKCLMLIAGVSILLVLTIVGIVVSVSIVHDHNNHEKGGHSIVCDGVEQPIIIAGDSVVFGNKTFSPTEIVRLKTKNEGNEVSTYSIFEETDQKTKACKMQMVSHVQITSFGS